MRIKFRVVRSRYRERMIRGLSPRALVLRHAIEKARRAEAPQNARLILAADTVVACDKTILGKPKTWNQAVRMLGMLSGRSHFVYTGVALLDREKQKMLKGVSGTKVWIKPLSQGRIDSYLKRIRPYDKAGAYAIQIGPKIVDHIEGSYTNVMGLPRERVLEFMKKVKEL